MLKGKKAQAGIGEHIGNILQTIPKPLKTAIFLMLLLIFAAIFGYILNVFGVHCNSEDTVYTIPVYNLYGNIELIVKRPALEEIRSGALQPESITSILTMKCVHYTNSTYYFEGAYCTNCNWTVLDNIFSETKVCEGDVYPYPDKGWFKTWICESQGLGCDVPENFFFNQSSGYLQLTDPNLENVTTASDMWNDKLVNNGGRELYLSTDTDTKAYDKAFRLTCEDLSPTLKFYGIPMFDFRIWLFLIVIGVFIAVLLKIHSME